MIEFEINQQTGDKISMLFWKKWFAKIGKALKIKKKLQVSVGIVKEGQIRKLNKVYRGKDKITDVLSFCEIDKNHEFVGEETNFLGEIIICYKQAERQAKKFGHSIVEEIEILLVHAFLHLLGHDHEKSAKEAELMEKMQQIILKSAN